MKLLLKFSVKSENTAGGWGVIQHEVLAALEYVSS